MINNENDSLNNGTSSYDDIYVNETSATLGFSTSFQTVTATIGIAAPLNQSFVTVHKVNSSDIGLPLMSAQKTCLVGFFITLIVITILGNTLIILSVITTRRLRTVTNCFVMSLAIADWMVGMFVTPPAVLLYIYGKYNNIFFFFF